MIKKLIAFLFFSLLFCPQIFADLDVHFVDVGQGDSILINSEGHWAVIDGGDTSSSSKLYSYANNQLNIPCFELVVLTHSDTDHVGGLRGIIDGKITKKSTIWYDVNDFNDNRAYQSFKTYVETIKCKKKKPITEDAIQLGGATITCIGPSKDLGNRNDNSLIIRLEYKGKSFVFLGDAGSKSMKDLVNNYASVNDLGNGFDAPMLNCDVLKVAHHGGKNFATYTFLKSSQPKYAVISVGLNKNYNHPHADTLSLLVQDDIDIYRTDVHGTIVFSVNDAGHLTVRSEKESGKPWLDKEFLASYKRKLLGIE